MACFESDVHLCKKIRNLLIIINEHSIFPEVNGTAVSQVKRSNAI